MKLSHLTLGLVAMSVTPFASAFAQSPLSDPEARPYAIRIFADAAPMTPKSIRYPARAANQGLSGHCSLRVDVDANGATHNIEVLACSSILFRHEAARAASALRFSGAPKSDMPLSIRWEMRPVESELAQLD